MSKIFLFSILAAILTGGCSTSEPTSFVVAERGRVPDCRVRVECTDEPAAFAAQELTNYVWRTTGVLLPIGAGDAARRIVLASGPDELGEDGFRIRVCGNELRIEGGRRGVLYGVYAFLRRFAGVEWYASWCEEVPVLNRLAASYVYDAFGRTISQTGPLADTFRFRHATRCFDAETGLYYHGYRFYSVIMRRWLTRDPSGENGGINLYVAMNNAAVCYYDPIGLRASFSINSAPQDNECIMSKGSKYPRAVTRRSGDISFSCDPDCRIVVSGKLKLWIEMLPEGNERWDTNYRRYKDSPIITERLNAYNHELDHFNTWSAFYQFLATANSYDGKRYANCDERVADLNARYSCFESETEKHSHQFDDKGKNMGGQYSRYPLDVSRFSWE